MSSCSIEVRSRSEEETLALGRRLAELLAEPATVGLKGPLGAGKTVVVRGMAEALGVDPREVCSPSFVYLVEYEEAAKRFFHGDLYRLAELPKEEAEGVYSGIGLYDAVGAHALAAVEWWEHYRGPLPERLVVVELEIENPEDRTIKLEFSGAGLDQVRGELARWQAR